MLVAPPGVTECCLLLAKAANEKQKASTGNQLGSRVFLFFWQLMIFGEIIKKCWTLIFILYALLKRNHMVPWRFSRIYMVIYGI